mmetsp:Transcript_12191/g.19874  ORF Transcript_12191/g.19874 Transcript_12191/m.19874 type:complete len:420 (-) Transcript_12191:1465-2724(-)
MLRHMGLETRAASRLYGLRSSISSVGVSVPRARAPIESMIRFTQSIITAFSGEPSPETAPTNTRIRATTFTVSWNWRNLRMLSYTERPQRMAFTMELNLSSRMTMSEASWATLVPVTPMLRPTLAAFRAGASLVPSPVTPTTWPPSSPRLATHSSRYPGSTRSRSLAQLSPGCASSQLAWSLGSPWPFSRVTSRYLSSGLDRASTCSLGRILSTWAGVILRKSGPSRAMPSAVRMPHCRAMARAVWMLSPVTMRTTTPARCAVATASRTSPRSGSWMPTRQSSTSPSVSSSPTPSFQLAGSSSAEAKSRCATAMVRSAWSAICDSRRPSARRSASVSASAAPPAAVLATQFARMISEAPFTYSRTFPSGRTTTAVERFLVELKGKAQSRSGSKTAARRATGSTPQASASISSAPSVALP